MRLSIKIPKDKIEEGLDEISSVMRHIRGLKPNQKNDFAINQTKAFEKNYNTLKLAIGGTGTFITLLSLVVAFDIHHIWHSLNEDQCRIYKLQYYFE